MNAQFKRFFDQRVKTSIDVPFCLIVRFESIKLTDNAARKIGGFYRLQCINARFLTKTEQFLETGIKTYHTNHIYILKHMESLYLILDFRQKNFPSNILIPKWFQNICTFFFKSLIYVVQSFF